MQPEQRRLHGPLHRRGRPGPAALEVDASSPADKAGCFEKALQAASPSLDGSCSALVLAGQSAGAEKAATALKPPTP